MAAVLLVAGAGVANAPEVSDSPEAAAQPNCLEMTISGAAADPAGMLTGALNDLGGRFGNVDLGDVVLLVR